MKAGLCEGVQLTTTLSVPQGRWALAVDAGFPGAYMSLSFLDVVLIPPGLNEGGVLCP